MFPSCWVITANHLLPVAQVQQSRDWNQTKKKKLSNRCEVSGMCGDRKHQQQKKWREKRRRTLHSCLSLDTQYTGSPGLSGCIQKSLEVFAMTAGLVQRAYHNDSIRGQRMSRIEADINKLGEVFGFYSSSSSRILKFNLGWIWGGVFVDKKADDFLYFSFYPQSVWWTN